MFAAVYDKLRRCVSFSTKGRFVSLQLRGELKVRLNAQIIKRIPRLPFLERYTGNIFFFPSPNEPSRRTVFPAEARRALRPPYSYVD